MAATQKNWLRLLEALEEPALADDPRFADNPGRMAHLADLETALIPLFKRRTTDDWLARLEAVGLPAGPVFDIARMHQDVQAIAREMIIDVPHARLGATRGIGMPVKFSETPAKTDQGAPVYGQHTRDVLTEHGYSPSEIDALIDAGAVIAA